MDPVKNFAESTLASGISSVATSLTVATGDGARFSFPKNATIWNSTDYARASLDPDREIVRVTNIAGDVLTITRAQESTTAADHNTGGKTYRIIQGVSEKDLLDLRPLTGHTTAPFDKTSDTTLADVPGLSIDLDAGESYTLYGRIYVFAGSGGLKIGLAGTATLTDATFNCKINSVVNLVTVAHDITSAFPATPLVGYDELLGSPVLWEVCIDGMLIVDAAGGGTFVIQFAQNTSNATVSEVKDFSHISAQKQ